MILPEDVYFIGTIGKPHGVKGEVSFHFNDDVFDRVEADYLVIETDGILVPFYMDEYRFKGNETALILFEGIDTQEKARQLTGNRVFFPRALADEGDTATSPAALNGFALVDAANGQKVGTVVALDTSTINTLLEVETQTGKTALVPIHDDLIKGIDKAQRTLTIDLPEGLFNT